MQEFLTNHEAQMVDIIENSFKDYHVKGFDYLCVKRSDQQTIKLYFFEGNVSQLPEVVNPHDHRYDFTTCCLSGKVTNRTFARGAYQQPWDAAPPQRYQEFAYRTPLNGGDGFEWIGETWLRELERCTYERESAYWMPADGLHTIQIHTSDTVLMLVQEEDKVPVLEPTCTFTMSKEPPALSGLYNRFTPDQVRARLRQLKEYAGIDLSVSAGLKVAA